MKGAHGAARLLAVVILVFAPLSFAYNGILSNARPSLKNDFTSYYVAGLAVREGMPEALYYTEPVGSLLAQASVQHPWIDLARPAGIENPNYYLYPPLFAVMFAPLTLLSYQAAYVVWIAVGALCLAVAVGLALGRFEGFPRSEGSLPAAAAVVLTACLFHPVSRTLSVGQSSLLLLALMMGALAGLIRRSRGGDVGAGICLAAGIMLKLTPVIFLPWLVIRRRWRALGATLTAFAALAAVSVAAVGVTPHRTYLLQMVGKLSGGTAFYPNQSFAGLFARAAGGDMRLADLADPSSMPALLARFAALGMLAVTFAIVWKRRRDDHEFGLLILASLFASPISWEHHYVLALIPGWVLVRDAWRGGFGVRRAAAAGVALALTGSYVGLRVIGALGEGVAAQAAASAGLAGGLLLWVVLALRPDDGAPCRRGEGAAAALLVMMSVFAAGNFLLKVAEYNRSYAYGDFTSYYVAAATIAEGRGDPLYYPGTPDRILARAETPSAWMDTAARWGVKDANYYLYPPFFAIAMTPLALLSYGAAHGLWYIANLIALGGFLLIWIRSRRRDEGRGGEGLSGAEVAMAVVAVALSWPSLFTFGAGQANFVVLLLLLGGLESLRRGRDVRAGLMTAGAVAIKLTPALLLVYLAWRKRWRALAAAVGGLAALVLAGAAVAGWGAYGVYVRDMVPLLSRGCPHWVNESLAAFFTRLVDRADMFSWALADPSAGARLLTSFAAAGLTGAAFAVIGRPGRGEGDLDLEFSLTVVTTLFVSPLTWTHHSVLSLLAFLIAARWLVRRRETTWPVAVLFASAFTLVNVYVKPPGLFEHGILRVLASYNLGGNLLLWSLLAMLILRARAGRRPAEAVA